MTLSTAITETAFRVAVEEVFSATTLSLRIPATIADVVRARRRGEPAPSLAEALPELPPVLRGSLAAVCDALVASDADAMRALVPRHGVIEMELGRLVRRGGELCVHTVRPGMSSLVELGSGHKVRMRWAFEAVAEKP